MKLQRIKAVAKKEFLHVLRDPRSLGLGIAIPMLLLFLFGYALTLDVDRVPLIVWDQSDTPASRELVSRFSGSRYFSLQSHTDNYRDIEQRHRQARGADRPDHPDRFRPPHRIRRKGPGPGDCWTAAIPIPPPSPSATPRYRGYSVILFAGYHG